MIIDGAAELSGEALQAKVGGSFNRIPSGDDVFGRRPGDQERLRTESGPWVDSDGVTRHIERDLAEA